MSVRGAQQKISEVVGGWPDVNLAPHRFGGVEYQLGSREFGHIHGDSLVDIPFPTAVRKELVAAGRAEPHHILPESGWISFYIRQPEDIDQAIALLQQSYQLAQTQLTRRHHRQKAAHDT